MRDRADQIHSVLERQWAPRQRPPSPCQRCQALAEWGLAPLDVGRVEHAVAVRAVPARLDAGGWAIHEAALEVNDAPRGIPFHDLRHAAVAPATPPRAPLPTCLHGLTTRLANRPYIGAEAVRTTPEGAVCRTAAHPLNEPAHQGQVARSTDLASEPQAGTDHQRQGHPHEVAWRLHAALVGLHMAQITWLFNHILLDRRPLLPCTCPPSRHRPLVEPEGRHDRLQRTTRREPCHHGHDQFSRRTQPGEDRACRSREGLMALLTNKPLRLARVDTAMALADLASGRTCQVRAEDNRGVQAGSPLLALLGSMPRRRIAGPHCCYKCPSPRLRGELPLMLITLR